MESYLFYWKRQIMKKVRPMQFHNNSVINLSESECLPNQRQALCRTCKEHELLYPCTCPAPIHRACIQEEFNSLASPRKQPKCSSHEQRYNCKKCAEVIRFSSTKELRCRSTHEIREFSKENCCMCTFLSISITVVLLMVVAIIVIAKANILADKVISDATTIGICIGMGITFLIILYFLISEVLLRTAYRVKLMERKQMIKGRSARKNEIAIIDCE